MVRAPFIYLIASMISIITPVYNTSKYLRRCLDSILAQTYQDWELLLIDDGSTDGSDMICDDYAKSDSRIRVFHKPNGGVASVRQLGIVEAQGEYSIHVDSDDWVEPEMLEALFDEAKRTDADIVVADYYHEFVDKTVYRPQSGSENPLTAIGEILTGQQVGSLWNKLIRHVRYQQYQLVFSPGINIGEDSLLLVRLYQHPVRIRYVNKGYYHYMNNGDDNSITRKRNVELYEKSVAQIHQLLQAVPKQYESLVRKQQRRINILAACEGVVGIDTLRGKGVTFGLKDLLMRDVGNYVRTVLLLYILHLDCLCSWLVQRKIHHRPS